MRRSDKLKIFNDPIYGFIGIPSPLIFDLISEPWFQRLRRISQMGLSYLVYPGAHHTRFHHALGSMHLMQLAIQVLRMKKVAISADEEAGLLAAILLHDIGHGPFSHAMENSLVPGVPHERISRYFMEALNERYDGNLEVALAIFRGAYPRKFMNQLVSSQLDMDRLDYLKRDSFYTGVAEGNINAERLITMLNVHEDALVVEEKGIYSVEKFLMARRFMYWQVYLHKTGLVAEHLLIHILRRARELTLAGQTLPGSPALRFFLGNEVDDIHFTPTVLEQFASLDDVDIMAAIKAWQVEDDFVLRNLCTMVLQRRLLHIKLKNKPPDNARFEKTFKTFCEEYGLSPREASYFVFTGSISNRAYDLHQQNINILKDSGKTVDVARASDHLNLQALAEPVTKYYRCHPKKIWRLT